MLDIDVILETEQWNWCSGCCCDSFILVPLVWMCEVRGRGKIVTHCCLSQYDFFKFPLGRLCKSFRTFTDLFFFCVFAFMFVFGRTSSEEWAALLLLKTDAWFELDACRSVLAKLNSKVWYFNVPSSDSGDRHSKEFFLPFQDPEEPLFSSADLYYTKQVIFQWIHVFSECGS